LAQQPAPLFSVLKPLTAEHAENERYLLRVLRELCGERLLDGVSRRYGMQ
jgi:hypothetical protein